MHHYPSRACANGRHKWVCSTPLLLINNANGIGIYGCKHLRAHWRNARTKVLNAPEVVGENVHRIHVPEKHFVAQAFVEEAFEQNPRYGNSSFSSIFRKPQWCGGVVDEEKLAVLETYVIGWVKEVISIRVLAQEMAVEAELVWVLEVENREVEAESELGDKSQGTSMASLGSHSSGEQVRAVSPCWHVNQLWGLDCSGRDRAKSTGATAGVLRLTGDCAEFVGATAAVRGGVRSTGAILDVIVGARSEECVVVVQALESVVAWDSPLGHIVGAEGVMDTVSSLPLGDICVTSPPTAVIGDTEAVLGSIIKKGRGHPTKGRSLVEVGGYVVTTSLTDSDISVVRGVEIVPNSLSHLQFADDTILFFDASVEVAWSVQRVLYCFQACLRLQLNFRKSSLMAIGMDADLANEVVGWLNCEHGSLPFMYLGLPLG
ncbi:hypothetical protein V6N12_069016 [Hibiscus sabdariffa]|uniref:Reverse transcriptase domain-containing protein n=1 Tax=Hibiscus sabdariffa TaxID=183260 RepID=A0ABR2FCR9_9ROSI